MDLVMKAWASIQTTGECTMGRIVQEIMQREVVTVTPDTPLRELLRVLVRAQVSGVPVVSEKGEIVGVVSATDVVRFGAGEKGWGNGDLGLEPLLLPGEEYDEDSAAPFFMVSARWGYPREEHADAFSQDLSADYTVQTIMTPAVFTVKPTDTVEDAAKFLLQGRIHRALVVEHGVLKGIVTAHDLLKAFVGDFGD
jgi:CBS domain-containing protein